MRGPASGFTLIEVLLATMLLAAGLALAFATVRAAGATVERGEAMAARNERIRAVSEFLRQRIGGAQGIVFELDQASGASRRFTGGAQQMRFVADLPDYLGRGGPHLHALGVARGGDGLVLDVDFRMVLAGQTIIAGNPRPPEPLADGLRSVGFAYRGPGKDGRPAPWLHEWGHPDALPSQVRVRIADARGAWPDVVIALPMSASYGIAPEDTP
ncbi:prepilin-type N-terminal cleavage/methylation domain-containing protein [Thermomonas sp. HDW16]|uniref:prepilin-type N-terminal cleavage/methylation domain-containing protein n=1 Tax=Thermomonas sp. HDW16 TaxID=2714945 RepID=UPI00140AF6FD|nr:prepilin-type N-terminal cleavage/methylation domain-containing protein [Thermomonas sp. HDW16]QIL21476.1 prepilin-type N-terminal cleavage/methylation domain-containing protein [Thermomonas sp. HDW16]